MTKFKVGDIVNIKEEAVTAISYTQVIPDLSRTYTVISVSIRGAEIGFEVVYNLSDIRCVIFEHEIEIAVDIIKERKSKIEKLYELY